MYRSIENAVFLSEMHLQFVKPTLIRQPLLFPLLLVERIYVHYLLLPQLCVVGPRLLRVLLRVGFAQLLIFSWLRNKTNLFYFLAYWFDAWDWNWPVGFCGCYVQVVRPRVIIANNSDQLFACRGRFLAVGEQRTSSGSSHRWLEFFVLRAVIFVAYGLHDFWWAKKALSCVVLLYELVLNHIFQIKLTIFSIKIN